MEYNEIWAVDAARIKSFFLSLKDAGLKDEGMISCGECSVRLTPLPAHPVGPVDVPRTKVEITGEDAAAEELYRRFFLRFISAGG